MVSLRAGGYCRIICFRVLSGFWRRGQVFFYRKAGRKLLCSVYLAFITESGCGEGVNIFRYRCHNISFTRPLFISCMCVCPWRVYKTPSKSTASRPTALLQKYALTPQYSCETTQETMRGSYDIEGGLGEL